MLLTGIILAGGEATRFHGAPKGLVEIGGIRVIDRVAAALGTACDALLLVANHPGAAAWLPAVPVATDVRPGCGALGGLHAALARARGPVLVVAWDMPFVTGALLRALVDAAGDGAEAVLPLGAGGHPEPVCAYYAPACLTVAERLLDAGERRASALGDAVGARRLEASAWGDPASLFFSLNTPADLATAQAMAAR